MASSAFDTFPVVLFGDGESSFSRLDLAALSLPAAFHAQAD